MANYRVLLIAILLIGLLTAVCADGEHDFYVSPSGKDAVLNDAHEYTHHWFIFELINECY
jgi:hypothetical protein